MSCAEIHADTVAQPLRAFKAVANIVDMTKETLAWARTLDLDLYVVGGALRDEYMGRQPKDLDFLAAGADVDDIKAALSPGDHAADLISAGRIVGVRVWPFGIGRPVEICPPRTEISTGPGHDDFEIVCDKRTEVIADLARRDFTVNAIARKLDTGVIVDPYNGIGDVAAGVLRTITPDSFRDDPLRMMRAFARLSQDGSVLDPDTYAQLHDNAHRMTHVSGERVGMELEKILGGEHVKFALRAMRDTGVMGVAFPELVPMLDFDQNTKYHDKTVDEHTFQVIEDVPASAGVDVRLAALFHDAGKPESAWMGEDNRLHYYANPKKGKADHADIGALIAWRVCRRLGYSKKRTDEVVYLVRHHMWRTYRKPKFVAARGFLAEHGIDRGRKLIALKWADNGGKNELGTNKDDAVLREFTGMVETEIDNGAVVTRGQLDITGDDVIALGVDGPAVGQILDGLLHDVIGQPKLNRREWLLKTAKRRVEGVDKLGVKV